MFEIGTEILSFLLSPIGIVTKQNWKAIPEHFPFIILDEFVIMPNHMHGILTFSGISKREFEPNKPETKKGLLGTIISLFKGSVTKYANLHKLEFGWQARYHDRIVK